MQVASVSTDRPTVRSEIDGWTFEDSTLLVRRSSPEIHGKIFIGYTPAPKDVPFYTSVLEMLADGWELLGPPQSETWTSEADGTLHEQWSWWLQRPQPITRLSDPWSSDRHGVDDTTTEDRPMTARDVERLAQAICGQVAKFSDLRMNDGDDIWRERELELRDGVAATANAICVALKLDANAFAAACGLHVSTGRDNYGDCRPGELTWEVP